MSSVQLGKAIAHAIFARGAWGGGAKSKIDTKILLLRKYVPSKLREFRMTKKKKLNTRFRVGGGGGRRKIDAKIASLRKFFP